MSDNEIFDKAIDRYGITAQITMVFEEMSELQKELCKHLRGRNNFGNIAEEIADVEIMLAQMKSYFGCAGLVESWKRTKIKRLAERLEKEN